MNLTSELKTWLLLKTMLRTTRLLEQQLREQNQILTRIADAVAPVIEKVPVDQTQKSVDYSTDDVQGKILDFSDSILKKIGRLPTEEEIVEHLEEVMGARQ